MSVPSPSRFLGSCFLGFIFGSGIAILLTLAEIGWQLLLFMLVLGTLFALAEYLLIRLPFHGLRWLWNWSRGVSKPVSDDTTAYKSTRYDIAGFWCCLAIPVLLALPNFVRSFTEA